MQNAIKAALVALVLAVPAAALASPQDVQGWQRTFWGMTPEELEAEYGQELAVENTENGFTTYKIKNFRIFGEPFQVIFLWENRNELSKVIIDLSEFGDHLDRRSSVAKNIEATLTTKYGSPTVLEDETKTLDIINVLIITKKLKWSFPSTIIDYDYSFSSSIGGENATLLFKVRYLRAPKDKL